MAPKDYRLARESTSKEERCCCVEVDGRPYLPHLNANSKDEESIKKVTYQVLFGSSSSSLLSSLQVSKVAGGITNALFRVSGFSCISDDYDSVLVRIFGAEGMIDRDEETSCYASLCDAGLAYRYLGRFGNGRLEGWLEGYRPLQVEEMSTYASAIAIQMSKLHKFNNNHNTTTTDDDEPQLWNQLWSWLKQASASSSSSSDDEQMTSSIETELHYLQTNVISKYNPQISFCHNDLLAANIMIHTETKQIQLIDFEYGGMNYTPFDIANHFNEYAGGTTNEDNGVTHYENLPTLSQQREFLQAYHHPNETIITDTMLEEIQAFLMINHLYWGLWAINQAITEGCDEFDYSTYANHRIQQYYVCKDQYPK